MHNTFWPAFLPFVKIFQIAFFVDDTYLLYRNHCLVLGKSTKRIGNLRIKYGIPELQFVFHVKQSLDQRLFQS